MDITQAETPAPLENFSMKYIAFCDILGFSAKLATDFDKTLAMYKRFRDSTCANGLQTSFLEF